MLTGLIAGAGTEVATGSIEFAGTASELTAGGREYEIERSLELTEIEAGLTEGKIAFKVA
jgi:hypothetical protein